MRNGIAIDAGVMVAEDVERTCYVLDHGYVKLVDYMPHGAWQTDDVLEEGMLYAPGDQAVVDAARVSYANGNVRKRTDKGLLRYLWKNQHLTPFEMVQFKFEVKLPLFIARQWMRHRTFSYNEVSGRYSEFDGDFYAPEAWRAQDTKNRQSSGGLLEPAENSQCRIVYAGIVASAMESYKQLIEAGASRELARMVLPQSMYTTFVFSCDLRNLMNFLSLRVDAHAQWEIQRYALAILALIGPVVPECVKLFESMREKPEPAAPVETQTGPARLPKLDWLNASRLLGLAIAKDRFGVSLAGECDLHGKFTIQFFSDDSGEDELPVHSAGVFVGDDRRCLYVGKGYSNFEALHDLTLQPIHVGNQDLKVGAALGFASEAMKELFGQ